MGTPRVEGRRDPHIVVPFSLQGGFTSDEDGRIEFSVKISFRAVLFWGVLLNAIVIPLSSVFQAYVLH